MDYPKQKYSKNQFEKSAWAKQEIICGIDEVGRGCLFGPLVVGCVILPPYCDVSMLVDSKKLSEKSRVIAASWINKYCTSSVISIDAWTIDKLGINTSTKLAVLRLFYNISQQSKTPIQLILTDHMNIGISKINQTPIISAPFGEDWSSSIAAASILAKVFRDQLLKQMSTIFPAFGLEKNKGYGTKMHTDGIREFGQSLLHRKTYCKAFERTPVPAVYNHSKIL